MYWESYFLNKDFILEIWYLFIFFCKCIGIIHLKFCKKTNLSWNLAAAVVKFSHQLDKDFILEIRYLFIFFCKCIGIIHLKFCKKTNLFWESSRSCKVFPSALENPCHPIPPGIMGFNWKGPTLLFRF